MNSVRVLVGTHKGRFVLTSDGARARWEVSGPHFPEWEIFHVTGSPADQNRLYASQHTSWFGQVIQRSDDGGATWNTVGNEFAYEGEPGTHHWYDGTPHPWEFARVWHLEPTLDDPDTVYAGVEDAALFRTTDGGVTWRELPGLRQHDTGDAWQPGAGGLCLHTILLDPRDPKRIITAVSAAGAFRSDDGGETWRTATRGLRSEGIPDPEAAIGHCVHHIANHPSRPDVLFMFMQKHWDVMRSDDAGDSWREVSGNLPSDFGFPIAVHAHEPETIDVVPIKTNAEHYPPEGKPRVYRSRTGGNEWGALTAGLPQQDCYVQRAARRHGGRLARGMRRLLRNDRRASLRVGQRRRQLDADCVRPAGSVLGRGPDAAMICVVLPPPLRSLAHIEGKVALDLDGNDGGPVTQRAVLDALEEKCPMLRDTIRDHGTQHRRPYLRFFACGVDLSHEPPDTPLPEAVSTGVEPFLVVGAMAVG